MHTPLTPSMEGFTVTVTEDGTATTDECTTVLSRYNEGPQCHSCDAKNPQDVDSLIG